MEGLLKMEARFLRGVLQVGTAFEFGCLKQDCASCRAPVSADASEFRLPRHNRRVR
jgi:hypothetical protein